MKMIKLLQYTLVSFSMFFISSSFSSVSPIEIDKEFLMLGDSKFPLVKKNQLITRKDHLGMFDPVSILPNIKDQSKTQIKEDMQGWGSPIIKVFTKRYRNTFKQVEAIFKFGVHFIPGGNYEGKGKYLDAIYVYPQDIDVAFGLKFSSNARVISVSNQGTKDMPIASVMIKIDYSIWNGFQTIINSDVFFLTGNGTLEKVDVDASIFNYE